MNATGLYMPKALNASDVVRKGMLLNFMCLVVNQIGVAQANKGQHLRDQPVDSQ